MHHTTQTPNSRQQQTWLPSFSLNPSDEAEGIHIQPTMRMQVSERSPVPREMSSSLLEDEPSLSSSMDDTGSLTEWIHQLSMNVEMATETMQQEHPNPSPSQAQTTTTTTTTTTRAGSTQTQTLQFCYSAQPQLEPQHQAIQPPSFRCFPQKQQEQQVVGLYEIHQPVTLALVAKATTAASAAQNTTIEASNQMRQARKGSSRSTYYKQQRLLLLHHAVKCRNEQQDGECVVTQHCAKMKRLWKHILVCKTKGCIVDKCGSSKYVLSHFYRCKDVQCNVCRPVRKFIAKSNKKSKK